VIDACPAKDVDIRTLKIQQSGTDLRFAHTAGRAFPFVKVVEMAEANPMICTDCGVPMNHHADKLRKETRADDASAFDSAFGGVIEEFHTCPQCGETASRRAPHSETS